MTALSNLVSRLDCETPVIVKLFPQEYVNLLLKNIRDEQLYEAKMIVKNYIEEELQGYVINYKLYSYKTLEGITVEILIQPENSSIVIQYLLELSHASVVLRRIR